MASIVTDTAIITVLNGKPYNIDNTHPNFEKVKQALRDKEDDTVIEELIDIPTAINNKYFHAGVSVREGVIYYHEQPVHNALTDRMLRMLEEGYDIEPMAKFLDRVMQNPSARAVNELYRFLEHNMLPITDSGSFMAYKVVRSDYKDKYSGRFDNSVGRTVSMARNEVNDDPTQTCSAGLHVCSKEYANGFFYSGGDRMMLVEVGPEHVVSVPIDYNNSKMRVCQYTVVAEQTDDLQRDVLEEHAVYGSDNDDWDDYDYYDEEDEDNFPF